MDMSEVVESCLRAAFSTKTDRKRITEMTGADAQSFIDLLDEVMLSAGSVSRPFADLRFAQVADGFEADESFSRACYRVLSKLCGHTGLLPTSFILSDGLSKYADRPVSGGGFSDLYIGRFNDVEVALKSLRVFGENFQMVQKVRFDAPSRQR